MKIHTFGDSHGSQYSGWLNCENVVTHHLGPVLCYSFGKEKLNRCDIRNYNLENGDSVIFCFGEIDCRNHVHKHITNEINYKVIINNIIENYIEAIKENITICQKNLKHVCIYNVIPPVRYIQEAPNHPFPYLGTDEERKTYFLYFNKVLKQKCYEEKFIFFDIYDEIKDNQGFLKKEFSDGNCHLKDHFSLNKFINKYLI